MNLVVRIFGIIFVVMIIEKFGFWVYALEKEKKRFWNLCNSLVRMKSRNLLLLKWW